MLSSPDLKIPCSGLLAHVLVEFLGFVGFFADELEHRDKMLRLEITRDARNFVLFAGLAFRGIDIIGKELNSRRKLYLPLLPLHNKHLLDLVYMLL